MDYELLAGFLAGMIILSATPGPDVFASMSKAVSDGFKSSLFFIKETSQKKINRAAGTVMAATGVYVILK